MCQAVKIIAIYSTISWCCVLGVQVFESQVQAAQVMRAPRNLRLRQSPNENSPTLRVIQRGENLLISEKTKGGWKKVLLKIGDRSFTGFVRESEIISKRQVEESLGTNNSPKGSGAEFGSGLGIGVAYGFYSQETRLIEGDKPLELGRRTGTSPTFTFFFEFPVKRRLWGRFFLGLRQMKLTGDGTIISSGGGGGTSPIQVNQDFAFFGGGGKYFLGKRVWMGIDFMGAKSISSKILFVDTGKSLEPPVLPFFSVAFFNLGVLIGSGKRSFLAPELKIGSIINTNPQILILEFQISLGFRI